LDKRLKALQSWLIDELRLNPEKIHPASADASFRRYFRVHSQQESFIAMDAPPDKEPISDFVRVNQALAQQAIHVPHIHFANHADGFILLEDLDDAVFLNELSPSTSQALYTSALEALIKLQLGTTDQAAFQLPAYSAELLQSEMQLFDDWYVQKHLEQTLSEQQHQALTQIQSILIAACLEQPQVWVHRDYHSRNLMVTQQQSPGVIDFQDMVLGPISYDLASLFKDCYIEWSRQQQLTWLEQYHVMAQEKLPHLSFTLDQLTRWYDLTGLQRHLKVLGIFCRLNYRDEKAHYLNDLPLVTSYVLEVCDRYPELQPLQALLLELQN